MSSPSLLLEDQLCFRFYTVVRLITRLYQPHLDRLVRLFFQPLLVLWALWSTGALKALCQRSKC